MTQPNNIVVIGAGIVGTSIAVNLLQYGSKITLIDKDTQTNGASRLSFAWINAAGKTPFDYHDLNRRSMEMWPRYGQSLGTNVGLKLGGTVTWETSDDRATALIQKVERAQSYGYPIRLASQSELQIHEPNLVIENVKAASICEIEGQVEPPRVIQAAIDKIIESGGEVSLGESFESFEFDDTNHQIVGVKTNNRTLPCDVVVIAAGIDTTEIGYKANTFLPQSTSPGVVVKTSPMPPLLNGIVAVCSEPASKPPGRRSPTATIRRIRSAGIGETSILSSSNLRPSRYTSRITSAENSNSTAALVSRKVNFSISTATSRDTQVF